MELWGKEKVTHNKHWWVQNVDCEFCDHHSHWKQNTYVRLTIVLRQTCGHLWTDHYDLQQFNNMLRYKSHYSQTGSLSNGSSFKMVEWNNKDVLNKVIKQLCFPHESNFVKHLEICSVTEPSLEYEYSNQWLHFNQSEVRL